MRIIAGKNKGRNLFGFEGDKIRPTSDKAREALFAILGNVTNDKFLDLCSGTGAIGLEAFSRGASVTFVDKDSESINLCKKNSRLVGFDGKIIKSDAISYLKNTQEQFDIIFVDPPYMLNIGEQIVQIVEDRGLLVEGGVLIYERDKSEDYSYKSLKKYKEKKYGKAIFAFYGREN
jgi:16S rRNA (guanine(966)-N(2))-methyltransferase RsmD